MRIPYDNLLKQASTVVATAQNPNYVASNLYDNTLQSLFKTTVISSLVVAEWASDIEISSFAVGNHNISSIVITFKDSGGGTIGSESYVNADLIHTNTLGEIKAQAVKYFTKVTGIRSVSMSITGTASPISIGNISLGTYLEFPYFNIGSQMPNKVTGNNSKTEGGILAGKTGVALEIFKVSFSDIELGDKESIDAFFLFVQTNTAMWLDRWELSTEFPVMFCNLIKSEIPYTKVNGRIVFSQMELEFEECK